MFEFIVMGSFVSQKYRDTVNFARRDWVKNFCNFSKMAPIGAKLCVSDDLQRFVFNAEKLLSAKFGIQIFIFSQFGMAFKEPRPKRPENQLPRQILL